MNGPAYRKYIEQSKSTIDGDSNWLITLADVMTLLMVFFVMFLVAKQAEKVKKPAETSSVAAGPVVRDHAGTGRNAESELRDAIALHIRELGMEKDVAVYTMDKDIVIALKENITFMPGRDELLKGTGPVLERIADVIRRNPSCTVEIDGYTDNVPIHTSRYRSNWDLSIARATGVLKYFTDKYDLDPSRFYIRGNADRRPLVSNDTPEQRAQNRRVEIRLKNTSLS